MIAAQAVSRFQQTASLHDHHTLRKLKKIDFADAN